MTIQELGSIGELLGAVAVVISLFYLAVQIRQNTKASRIESFLGAQQQVWQLGIVIAQDESVAKLLARFLDDPGSEFSSEDRVRIGMACGQFLGGLETLFRLYEEGMIEEEDWENIYTNNLVMLLNPGVRFVMSQRKGMISERFGNYVQENSA